MNTIQIDDNWRVQYDGRQYSLERYDKGGREARNPATGEMIQTKAKWVPEGRYPTTMASAVSHVVKVEVSEQASDLREFVELQAVWEAKLEKMLGVQA